MFFIQNIAISSIGNLYFQSLIFTGTRVAFNIANNEIRHFFANMLQNLRNLNM